MSEWNKIILTEQEIRDEPPSLLGSCNGTQIMLSLLKRKGAPVLGNLFLEFDHKNYDFQSTRCFDKGVNQFEFYYIRRNDNAAA